MSEEVREKFYYVPVYLDKDGNSPLNESYRVKTRHEVWDQDNVSRCVCMTEDDANLVVTALNQHILATRMLRNIKSGNKEGPKRGPRGLNHGG